jgi:NadR type nicotinamide-nucleotide adenylyltransferase
MKPERILILGPESTGKSTLAADLASHFQEPWVPEFARDYLENLSRPYEFEDLSEIAKGQIQLEENLALKASSYLFVDTDLRVIKVWSEHKFKKVNSWILDEIKRRTYAKILVTDIDLPWEADPLREHPEPGMRQYFLDKYLELAQKSGFPFQLISGNHQTRLDQAIYFISKQ